MNDVVNSKQIEDTTETPKESESTHSVLINSEEQYSLWPLEKSPPLGWQAVYSGSRENCLEYVETRWSDMRPKSVRG